MPAFKPGKIERVAGPVIVSNGMLGSQMYEVVRVGDQGLIGEIIHIEGDKATVQVYEETAGIRPGEAVQRTGQALSVELGPGITGQIYDGIQRPLTVLFEKTGPFVRRGIAPSPIDKSKKWHFVPTISNGANVSGGDVLGTVKETSLITQRILVPPNLSGQITHLEGEGDYTVTEQIAELQAQSGPTPLYLMSSWPVRTARPVKRKLPSDTPLLTGQRIMDFFFPIVKGGTAAIPGGFGTGKCVDPETPILLADGRLRRMRELVGNASKSRVVESNANETIYQYNDPLRIVSLSNPEFNEAEAPLGYKGHTQELVSVKTRSGRMVKVTPVHQLHQLRQDGTVVETPAGEIKTGDFLVAPRKIPLSLSIKSIDPCQLLPGTMRIRDPKSTATARRLIRKLARATTLKALSKSLHVSYPSLLNYLYGRACPTLSFFAQLSAASGEKIPVEYVEAQRQEKRIRVPPQMTADLAELIGLILSDGTLRAGRIVALFNNDQKVLGRFTQLAQQIFEVRAKPGKHRGGSLVAVDSTALASFLVGIGVPAGKKSRIVKVPDLVCMSPDNVMAGFLVGYAAGGGSFREFALEIGTASQEMALGLSYLLTRLGVLHRTMQRQVDDHTHHRVIVEGKDAITELFKRLPRGLPYSFLGRMAEYVNNRKKSYNSTDTVPLGPSIIRTTIEGFGLSRKELEENGLWTRNYTELGEKPTVATLKRFVAFVKERGEPKHHNSEALENLEHIVQLSEHTYFDEVVDVQRVPYQGEVLDVAVPGYENFVGGWGPMICHNTMMQQQLAKWADASVIVYVGCGERGNEMAEVLETFPKLTDPRSGEPLMNRTILVANTSNMPIAAREASVYTGITIAEYFRDMGYDVALMADSTSRWAEALREISGRLEEMPGEEGYPAYLASKLAEFYERAGRVEVLGAENKIGSISVVGAVSPPGGDFSEPVTQNTLRIVKVFWALDTELAHRRHFPAINWLTSYSLYTDNLDTWYEKEAGDQWVSLRKEAMSLLQRDEELREIVMLVGPDALSEGQRVILEAARMIKEDFLMQHAYHQVDSYCDRLKTYRMMRLILDFYGFMQKAVEGGIPLQKIVDLPVKSEISRMRLTPGDKFDDYAQNITDSMNNQFKQLIR